MVIKQTTALRHSQRKVLKHRHAFIVFLPPVLKCADSTFCQQATYCAQTFSKFPEVNCRLEPGRNYFLTKLQLFPINSRQTDKSKSFQLILKSHFAKGGFCGALPGDAGVRWGRGPAALRRVHCTRLVIHPDDEKLPERKLMRNCERNRRRRERN